MTSLPVRRRHAAHWAAAHAALDDPGCVAWLLGGLREAGAGEQAPWDWDDLD